MVIFGSLGIGLEFVWYFLLVSNYLIRPNQLNLRVRMPGEFVPTCIPGKFQISSSLNSQEKLENAQRIPSVVGS
jgi:hypothetical protein